MLLTLVLVSLPVQCCSRDNIRLQTCHTLPGGYNRLQMRMLPAHMLAPKLLVQMLCTIRRSLTIKMLHMSSEAVMRARISSVT